jgi:hypothetical protein
MRPEFARVAEKCFAACDGERRRRSSGWFRARGSGSQPVVRGAPGVVSCHRRDHATRPFGEPSRVNAGSPKLNRSGHPDPDSRASRHTCSGCSRRTSRRALDVLPGALEEVLADPSPAVRRAPSQRSARVAPRDVSELSAGTVRVRAAAFVRPVPAASRGAALGRGAGSAAGCRSGGDGSVKGPVADGIEGLSRTPLCRTRARSADPSAATL